MKFNLLAHLRSNKSLDIEVKNDKEALLAQLATEQALDNLKNTVTPEFIEQTDLFDTLPGATDRDKIIWILLKFKLSSTRIAKALKITEKTVKRTYQKGFSE